MSPFRDALRALPLPLLENMVAHGPKVFLPSDFASTHWARNGKGSPSCLAVAPVGKHIGAKPRGDYWSWAHLWNEKTNEAPILSEALREDPSATGLGADIYRAAARVLRERQA